MSRTEEVTNGTSRAAILLMSLGEDAASEVLKYIDPQEVQQVGQAMAEIGNVSREQVNAVVENFAVDVAEQTALGIGNEEYLRTILGNALGSEKAQGLIERILQGRNTKGLEALKWMEPSLVANILYEEHSQVVAVVLAHLTHGRAASVLKLLPEELQSDVLMRVANLSGITRAALTELDELMEQRIALNRGDQARDVGGKRAAAEILHRLGAELGNEVVEKIRETDDRLGLEIQDLMFVFDSLGELDDREMQTLLREVNSETLGVALKGAEPATQEHVLSNMSSRAADILKEDMEAKGPVRLSEVETAQKEILATARSLADEGKISLGATEEEYV